MSNYLSSDEEAFIIEPRPLAGFVETPYIKEIAQRALNYIKAGFPVHFRGVSGTGKTTLAMHVASKISRPVVLIHGDDQLGTSDLVGGEHGYRYRRLVDNFISRVMKTEEDMTKRWADNRLTIACKNGHTLVYDEFTRSRPEANNILLSVLQEKVMDLPANRDGEEAYLRVHPNFTAIFTSNPEEYAGVHKAQDALRDRMITIDLDYMDRQTEIAICEAKSGLPRKEAAVIVDIVRDLRNSGEYEFAPTVRGAVMIARSCRTHEGAAVARDNEIFRRICRDILSSETSRLGTRNNHEKVKQLVDELVEKKCKKTFSLSSFWR
ncbi:gas vesicle protein GvpN [Candidatus Falkowbacteria bacterium]|nr:gas vesicle protein GvpN [Candidatus Falkowbacteria bacterium]